MYPLGGDLYFGVDKIRQINGVPVFIYHYPDNQGILIHDQTYPNQPDLGAISILHAFRTIDAIIQFKLNNPNRHINGLLSNQWISSEIQRHQAISQSTNVIIANYPTLKEISTINLANFLRAETQMTRAWITQTISQLPNRIRNRDRTLIFCPRGRMFEHGNDPYSGMFAFFDYAFCRTGGG